MPRLLFEKTGDAVWISHLDLMRLFQRAFKRAGLPLTHTQGYNPRPSVSIAMPLSVGVESVCELLDFDLEGEKIPNGQIVQRLNEVLIKGIRVLDCVENGKKLKELAYLDCKLMLQYDHDLVSSVTDEIAALFARESLIVEKKGKNGPTQQDIIPMIKAMSLTREGERHVCIRARVCCQNPSLNPMQIVAAIGHYLPELAPNHAICRRMEIYDLNERVFR